MKISDHLSQQTNHSTFKPSNENTNIPHGNKIFDYKTDIFDDAEKLDFLVERLLSVVTKDL